MKKSLLLSALFTLLFLGSALQAATETPAALKGNIDTGKHHSADEVKVLQQHIKKEADLIQAASPEIQKAIQGIIDGVGMMMNGKNEDANLSLTTAAKIFDEAIKANPDIGLVAIENKLQVHELVASEEEIKSQTRLIQELLEKNELQEAREMIQPLQNEIDITTTYLPVKLFADATAKALETLQKNDSNQAVNIIRTVLNTLVTVKLIMPIPLILSEDLLIQASTLDKSKKEDALNLLDEAKSQLSIALLLGYTDKHSDAYITLNAQIKDIQNEIKGKNDAEKLYEKAKESFKKLEEKVREEKIKINNAIAGKPEK